MGAGPTTTDNGRTAQDRETELSDLFNVHAALIAAENARPHLKRSPRWRLLRMDAYEAFWRAMDGGRAG